MSITSTRIEGDGSSMLSQAIGLIGHNSELNVVIGTIKEPLPDIEIIADGIDFKLEKDDVVIAEHLTEHERTWRLKPDGAKNTYIIDSPLEKGDRVFVVVKESAYYVIDKAVVL